MGAQISIIRVLLHVSHHLLNPEEGGFREFKDEDISSKKRRLESVETRHGCNHILSPTPDGDSHANQESSPKVQSMKTKWRDLIVSLLTALKASCPHFQLK